MLTRSALFCLIVASAAQAEAPVAAAPQRRTVVALYSVPQDLPGLRELSQAIADGLQKGAPGGLDLYSEYTGLDRFSGTDYESSLLTLYYVKFASRPVDLLVLVGPSALDFVLAKKLLPGVPIVTCY